MTDEPQRMYELLRGVRERVMGAKLTQPVTTSEVEGTLEDMMHLGEAERVPNGNIRLRTTPEIEAVIDDVRWWLNNLEAVLEQRPSKER